MFGELPKIFDRNFVIGYFLPVVTFTVVSLGLIHKFNLSTDFLPLAQKDILLGTTVIGLASWLGGVCLLATNRSIIRVLEGYGRFNPFHFLAGIQKSRYEDLRRSILELDEECIHYTSSGKEVPEEILLRRAELMAKFAEQFPDHERWLLPTAFGNAIRAFEVYPRVMYGLDAIPGWNRLIAVIPKEYRELVDTAKAETDFWVNLWALSFLIIFEYIGVTIYTRELKIVLLPLGALGVALTASSRAMVAAIEWGDLVKASFDTFLPDLCKKLGFSLPATKDQEHQLWTGFTQAILYRLPSAMIERAHFQLNGHEEEPSLQKAQTYKTG